MEKLINKSIYCDYNSTSPLSKSVTQFLGGGDFLFANPSSVHQLGKKSKKSIRETQDYILDLYGLEQKIWRLIFHSGATEGLNSIYMGFAYKYLVEGSSSMSLYFSPLDHSCVLNLLPLIKKLGVKAVSLPTLDDGSINEEEAIKLINEDSSHVKILNYTWINNETGLVQSLEIASKIKDQTGVTVIVDAVQSPGKISDWKKLYSSLDAYVFSAHKFGALKGTGFSLVKNDLSFSPLLFGGGQNDSLRSGTENITGIQSIKLAYQDLEKITSRLDFDKQKRDFLKDIEEHIFSIIDNEKMMVSRNLNNRSNNTICFISPSVKSNVIMMSFDLNGLQVSSGSACSSGASLPSRILLELGYSNDESLGGIRMSFGPELSKGDVDLIKKRLTDSLGKYYYK